MLSVQTAGKLDAGCRMQVFCISSSALAKRMQRGQGTSHLPSLPPLCGPFSPHHHHHIIYLCPFFWEAVRKLKEYLWLVQTCKHWQCLGIYGLQNTFKWGSLQRSMPISRGDSLRQFETCVKFIVVLKYYWAIPSLNVIHQTWFTCLVCSCSAPTVFAGRLLHNLIQTARGRGTDRTTDDWWSEAQPGLGLGRLYLTT